MINAIRITPEGDASHIEIDGLADMQGVVDGYIELVFDPEDNYEIYVNEEGLLHGLPLNALASLISGRRIVGTALVTGRADKNGDLTSVPKGIMKTLHMTSMIMEISGQPVGHPRWDTIRDA